MKNKSVFKHCLTLTALLSLSIPGFSSSALAASTTTSQSLESSSGNYEIAQAGLCRVVSTRGSNLIIRKGPSTNTAVVGSLSNGTRVYIGNQGRGGWVPVVIGNGRVGYVAAVYLRRC